jgi:predicted ATPase/DNA-binding CsgD family transcriptional regulator
MPGDWRLQVPLQLSSFIGRDGVIAEVVRLLGRGSDGPRLLTLTGAGGVGKTRLAFLVASSLGEEYPDGVWLVELAPVARPTLVVQTVADLFGIREEQDRPLIATLASSLRQRKLLLVLDNCEHLVDACASLAEYLLSADPEVRILATSREPLAITGEMVWRVAPLMLPYPERLPPLNEAGRCESVQLFVDRARAVLPGFALSNQNLRPVAEICYRLDGIPLAIELAAARVTLLSPAQIAARLDDRFDLLTAGRRTALPRQQTLRATIDWSYELLSVVERRLFQHLSVFAGGFSLEAVERISGGGGPGTGPGQETSSSVSLDVLGALVDKSLVVAEQDDGRTVRYRLLESLREYARECLDASEEAAAVDRRHALFFRDLVERAEPELNGDHQLTWFELVKHEYPNIRAALRWAIARGEAETALRIGGALGWFWEMGGHHTEGRRWLSEMLALPEAAPRTMPRARALSAAGFLTWVQGDFELARAVEDESLSIGRELGNQSHIGWALSCLGNIARSEADYGAAWRCYSESRDAYQQAGDRWGTALSTFLLGTIAYFRGEYARARELFEESLATGRAIGDRWTMASSLGDLGDVAYREGKLRLARALSEQSIAVAREMGMARVVAWRLFNLGRVALAQDELADARTYFHQSLSTLREPGDLTRIAVVLEGLAGLAARGNHPERAFRLVSAASAIRETIGAPRSPGDQADLERWLAPVRHYYDEQGRGALQAQGRAMTLDQAIEYALDEAQPAPASASTGPAATLSPREREVALLVAEGCTNREIAEQLVISEGTARVHVSHILDRLGLRSRAQLAVWVVETGLHANSSANLRS